ncbi:MAG: hypothetical protein ABIU05_25950, partial [Nitrospirales bacterium]
RSLLRNRLHYETREFGIIQDRLRIAYFADIGSSLPQGEKTDIRENIGEMQAWVREVLISVREG